MVIKNNHVVCAWSRRCANSQRTTGAPGRTFSGQRKIEFEKFANCFFFENLFRDQEAEVFEVDCPQLKVARNRLPSLARTPETAHSVISTSIAEVWLEKRIICFLYRTFYIFVLWSSVERVCLR